MKLRIIIENLIIILCVIGIFLISYNISKSYLIDRYIKVSYDNIQDYNNNYLVKIKYSKKQKELLCKVDNNDWVKINKCKYNLKAGNHIVYLKNKLFFTQKEFEIKETYEGNFYSSLDNIDEYYLALNGEKTINFIFDYEKDFNKEIKWSIEDEDIISINGNTIKGLKEGTTYITARLKDGNFKKYKIIVTSLIIPASHTANRRTISCRIYTEEQEKILDKILESRVNEAGYKTRGGVVAAARFLTLEFPYYISYFAENGRLDGGNYYLKIDGEGRFYHKGLYLTDAKFIELDPSASTKTGPAPWGCGIYSIPMQKIQLNGFDCSGFVTWAFYNGGFDSKDVGAGDNVNINNELSDLGEHNQITYEFMKNGKYKVGDFIASNGHAALIIGIDDNNIYTAESIKQGLRVHTYGKYSTIITDPMLTYIIDMDNNYEGEGIYTNMW